MKCTAAQAANVGHIVKVALENRRVEGDEVVDLRHARGGVDLVLTLADRWYAVYAEGGYNEHREENA